MARTPRYARFDACFDEDKLVKLSAVLPKTIAAMNELAPWQRGKWPTEIKCMSHERLIEGRKRGAGHGYTYINGNKIWMNRHMTFWGYWLVYVHENLHHAFPDATEPELNCELLPWVFERVWGRKLNPAWARKHGVGSPVEGVGDRSYCR